MTLTRRQMACFERNPQFLDEVAAALLPIAAAMTKQALVIENTAGTPELNLKIAAIMKRIADQIFKEQGISVQETSVLPSAAVTATSGSTAMKYLVQQMLLSPLWTMTPDEWATDEMAAVMIGTTMQTMLTTLTAVPATE